MENDKWREPWTKTEGADAYGELFYKRATGEKGEMESSKAAATRMRQLVQEGDTVLDVGCGAGHYLVSLKKTINAPFTYIGVDATETYVELGQKAFSDDANVSFRKGDIFGLPVDDKSADVTMCCNVLLHLPSVSKPLTELVRVSRRHVLVRTLIGKTSFVIKHVNPADDGNEFEGSEPRGFHYLNIYSESYLRHLLKGSDRVAGVAFEPDTDFDAAKLADTAAELTYAWNATRAVNGMQISGYVVQPWTWLKIDLKD